MGSDGALTGIRVADFCHAGIGPITGHLLADFGAEVIKIETSTRYDVSRLLQPYKNDVRDPEGAVIFARYNQNKHGVLLNLKRPEAVALAKRIVALSDVVLENFTLGTMDRLGLGYEHLRKVKPDIVYASLTFAGQTGPYRNFRGLGGLSQALAGLNDLTGYPDGLPCSPVSAYTDHYAPPLWALSVIAALDYRRRTGRGQFLDCSAFEAAVECLDGALLDYTVNGRTATRRGNRHPYAAPHGVYPCRGEDRWCAIAVFTDGEWEALCRIMGHPFWLQEQRFATLLGRRQNIEELDRLIGEWTKGYESEELACELQAAGIAAGKVSTPQEMYEDAQLNYRGHFWQVDNPEYAAFTYEAPSARLSEGGAHMRRVQPWLGEYNDHVFTELLGLSGEQYAQYLADGIIE